MRLTVFSEVAYAPLWKYRMIQKRTFAAEDEQEIKETNTQHNIWLDLCGWVMYLFISISQ
jgi:hypothetical protein